MHNNETEASVKARVAETAKWAHSVESLYQIIIDDYLPIYCKENGGSYRYIDIEIDATHWGGPYSSKKIEMTIENVIFELAPHKGALATKDQLIRIIRTMPKDKDKSVKMQIGGDKWRMTTSNKDKDDDWVGLDYRQFERGMKFLKS